MVVAKEMAQLDFEEGMAIGFAVDYSFTNGSVGNVEWELEGNTEDYMSIAEQIRDGKTECDSGSWSLSIKRYKRLDI